MATRLVWKPVYDRRARVNADRFFNELWKPFPFENNGEVPPMDVIEYDDHLAVRVNLVGVAPEDVTIEFNKGVMTISTPALETEEELTYLRRERYHGAYHRAFQIPETIDASGAEAAFENGVLYLKLPKKPETQPVRIKINHQN